MTRQPVQERVFINIRCPVRELNIKIYNDIIYTHTYEYHTTSQRTEYQKATSLINYLYIYEYQTTSRCWPFIQTDKTTY